jgi:hypothetical protein
LKNVCIRLTVDQQQIGPEVAFAIDNR